MKINEVIKRTAKFTVSDDRDLSLLEEEDRAKLVELLTKKCPTILSAYRRTNSFLYRGINYSFPATSDIVGAPIRTDRRPTEMPMDLHRDSIIAYNDLGIESHRGNSIFTNTSVDIANGWGKSICAVFPIDPFKFSYLQYLDTKLFDYSFSLIAVVPYNGYEVKGTVNNIKEVLVDNGITDTDLESALRARNTEVLISGSAYYAVNVSSLEKENLFRHTIGMKPVAQQYR